MWLPLLLLALAEIGFAQPEWYGLWTTSHEITDIEVCVRGDTADVLFIEIGEEMSDSSGMSYLSYDMNMTARLEDPWQFVTSDNSLCYDVSDFVPLHTEGWISVMAANDRCDDFGWGSFYFSTSIVTGTSWDDVIPVETSSYVNFPDFASGSWTEGHSLRVNDGRIGVCYVSADIGPFDVWCTTHYQEYDSTFAPTIGGELSIGGTCNDPLNRAIGIPLPNDSLIVYSDFGFTGDQTMFLGPISGMQEQRYYSHPICGDSRLLRELYITDSDRIIAVLADNTLYQFIPVAEGQTDCVPFAELPTDWSPSWAFHSNFGFAAVHVDSTHLYLARLDTSGLLVQPTGIFFEPEFPITLADADVTISDSGQVVIVWSEVINEWEGPHALNVGWIDWADPLGTDATCPAIPTSLSLSAFPNPFNSSVKIEYVIAKAGEVKLEIFDLNGRLVEILTEEHQSAGRHEKTWSPRETTSGVYFARLTAPSSQKTAKLLFIK